MNKTFQYLTRLFFRGLLILAPFGITVYALYFIFSTVDDMVPWLNLPTGVGFVMIVFIVVFVGFLGTRFFFGRWVVEAMDYLLEHTPGIRFIYTSVKEILDSFMGDKKKFNDPVWVKVGDTPEMWRIGFITQKKTEEPFDSGDFVAVYLPHSYAISGWVILVKKSQTRPVQSMNAVEAMKFAVSGGVTGILPNTHHEGTEKK